MEKMHFDKGSWLHFGVCCAITFIFGVIGAVFAEGLSLGKEYGDSCYEDGHFCISDLLADNMGILAGLLLRFLLSRLIG